MLMGPPWLQTCPFMTVQFQEAAAQANHVVELDEHLFSINFNEKIALSRSVAMWLHQGSSLIDLFCCDRV